MNGEAVPTPAPVPEPAAEISPEFILRVNDFIEMANRLERRLSTHHAQLVMLHAFTRYSAHHYLASVKNDDAGNREAFADYISVAVRQMVSGHIEDLSGGTAAAAPASPTE